MPTTTTSKPTPGSPPQSTVEAAIIELLAQALSEDEAALRSELTSRGSELPVDSLLLVEILCDLEERFGVRLPEDKLTASSLRSVAAFARRICHIATAAQKATA